MKIDTEELENLIVVQKLSYEKIGKIYNCTGNNIKKIAKRRGIILENRRTINKSETFNKGTGKKIFCLNCNNEITHKYKNLYCNNKCQHDHKSKIKYEYFLTNPDEFQVSNFSNKVIKRFILKEQNNKCSICGLINIWNNKPIVFILDHIDGNSSNNTRENLRCVCPNCDSQLDTYKSKNKNSNRYYYRYRYNGK